jgi:hypothetical protein
MQARTVPSKIEAPAVPCSVTSRATDAERMRLATVRCVVSQQ